MLIKYINPQSPIPKPHVKLIFFLNEFNNFIILIQYFFNNKE